MGAASLVSHLIHLISFVSTSEKLGPSSYSALWKLELGHLFVTFCNFVTSHVLHDLHIWLRGAAVRTAADTVSPAAMSDPLEEAEDTGHHTAMLNLSSPVKVC